MVKTSKIIATLGVAAGLGIALLPLASYATDPVETIEVNVAPEITLTVRNMNEKNEDDESELTRKVTLNMSRSDENTTIEHIINVDGNYDKGYSLTMKPGGTGLVGTINTEASIPAISGSSLPDKTKTIEQGGHGWGYRTSTTAADSSASLIGSYGDTWAGFTASDVSSGHSLHTDASSTTKRTTAFDDDYYVNFGIVTASDEVADVYTQTITYSVVGQTFAN